MLKYINAHTLYLIIFLALSACASRQHQSMHGSVAMKIDDQRGVGCFEPGTVKKGDKLKFLNNNCSRSLFPDVKGSCELEKAGEIRISKILNPHYAEFIKLSGPDFYEGSIIQIKTFL